MIDKVYDSFDFKERVPEICIPHGCRMQKYDDRVPSFYVEYEITRAARINEPIEDSEFVIQLPVGTKVSDSRNEKSSTVFVIHGGSPISSEGLESVIPTPPSLVGNHIKGRTWRNALLAGVGGGLLLLVVIYVVSRRNISRKRTS